MSGEWFLGVDAGATRCRARLRDATGAFRAEAEGPAANAYIDFDRAIEVARATLSKALDEGAVDPVRVRLGLGVAGISRPEEAVRFAAAFSEFASAVAANDAVTACIGAHRGADGGLIIVGTGSAGLARVAGRQTFVGGRGFHLGDDGSASRLGLEAARAALRAADGLGPDTALTKQIRARFGDDPLAMIEWAPKAKAGDYGAFAPLVLEAAHSGDPVARGLVADCAAAVARLVEAVEALGAPRVAMVGGLSEALRPFLDAALSTRIAAPLLDPTDGAILLAGGGVE